MTSLPEGWESDYDGTRWFFRYKATGNIQYHFPQPGDEYAEFFLDAGTGPIQLSPEETLAIEQQKQKGVAGLNQDVIKGTRTSGSKREKKKSDNIGGEYGMSATGYFDPMDFSGAFSGVSPVGEDDEETVELDSQQVRSPVGYVAELATQETVKCAEELAPVELDGTSATLAPIQTNMAHEPAELPTHGTPIEEKSPDPDSTQTTAQLVDPSSVTSASFAYSTTMANVQPTNGVPSRPSSIKRKPVSSAINPPELEQNKSQPWKPAQGVVEQSSQVSNTSVEALPQTSVLQNQNSELALTGREKSEDGSSALGNIPNALLPPSAPNKPAPVESLTTNNEAASVLEVLQPAQLPVKEPVPPETNNHQFISGTQVTHNSTSVSIADNGLSYTPTVLKPGGKNQESPEGSESLSHHVVQDSFSPVVAPLNFVKRHSSKSSQVSSIMADTPQSSKPVLSPSDDISDVISVISSFTPQTTPNSQPPQQSIHTALSDTNKPRPNSISEGAIGRPDIVPSARPQSISGQSPPAPVMNMQQYNTISPAYGPTPPSAANTTKPPSVNAAAVDQPTVISPASNIEAATMPAGPNMHNTHTRPPVQGMPMQNQKPSPPSPHQIGNSGHISMSPTPIGSQGRPSNTASTPSLGSAQASTTSPMNQNHQHFAQNNHTSNTGPRPPQAPQVNMSVSNVNGAINVPVIAAVPQTAYQPQGQVNASTNSVSGPSAVGHFQGTPQKPSLQHPATTVPSSHQPSSRPPAGYQTSGSAVTQITPQPAHQHHSPVTQSVSPIQSQVSSPAQSIASLHISQASTPSNTFATINSTPSGNSGSNVAINATTTAPVRPSSVPAYAPIQQVGNAIPPVNLHPAPTSAVGNQNGQPFPMGNSPVKPYPMLPGQVTPLPSQVGAAPVPSPIPQSANNNYPTFNTQQTAVGQQPIQAVPGGLSGHHAMPGQMNPMPNSAQGNMVHGPASSQIQMKPPQQPISHLNTTHAGGHQHLANPPQHQPQQTASHPSVPPGQTYNPQTPGFPSAGSLPAGGQNTFPPPPATQVTAPPIKPFASTQAGAALTDAGKGMKKWAKKMLKNPALKQTTVAVSGALFAESMGLSAGAGAQIANSVYTNATRPPLAHAQTAPPQGQGIPGTAPQHQSVQMGQQNQPGKIQPLPPQQNYHPPQSQPVHPSQQQPGRPNQQHPNQQHPNQQHPGPQPAHPTQPQSGRPNQQPLHPIQQQPGHFNQSHPVNQNQPLPGQSQQGPPKPTYPQAGQSHVGQSQPVFSQPVQQPVGAQTLGRPPVQAQNPSLQVGIVVNAQAQAQAQAQGQVQAQAQAGFYQRPQYPLMNPVMMNNAPPPAAVYAGGPPNQANGQANIDPTTANAVATMVGTAVGTALRPDHSQPQNAPNHTQGYGHQDYPSHSENHAGAYEHPAQTSAAYTDSNYVAADTTYMDNSNYAVNNNYVDNTDVNNTIVIDNSTTVIADTTYYDNTNYADTTSFSNTDVTNTTIDYEVNSAVYTDGNVTAFSMDESINMVSTSDVAVASADYSGDSWGDFSF